MNDDLRPNAIPGSMVTWLRATVRRWYADEQGATSTFILIMLPLFMLALFGLNAVWQVATIKQALRTGVYQATRFLSAEPQQAGNQRAWRDSAYHLIERELADTPAWRMRNLPLDYDKTRARPAELVVDIESVPECNDGDVDTFGVIARLQVNLSILEGLPGGGVPVPGILFTERADGEVICGD